MPPPNRVLLLGVPLDPVTGDEAVVRLNGFLRGGQHHVMTPNSEMLVAASSDAAFHDLLNRTELNLPDGTGLLWMASLTGQHLPARVTGVDTVTAFCKRLSEEHPVFLLGAAPGVAATAGDELKRMNPHLKIAGAYAGSPAQEQAADIIDMIRKAKPHVLFVAYGAPAQDLWIDRHLKNLPSVRVAMGVGGTFDFLSGTRIRAPKFLQALSLEWMWRLLLEPSRWRRIWTAVAVFPFLVLRNNGRGKKSA